MAVKKIIKFPAPSLRTPCREVPFPLSDEVREHIGDLRDTLSATPNGVALASNQVLAEGWSVFVVKPQVEWPLVRSMSGEPPPQVVINPTISEYPPHEIDIGPTWAPPVQYERELFEYRCFVEGCLSVPELNAPNPHRGYWIEMEYWDEEGRKCIYVARGLTARMIQHECDHLAGKLIYDYASKDVQLRVRAEAIRNRKRGK
jgi:peptide deformylase